MTVEMQPVVSSNVEAVGYDDETNELHVRFKSGLYIYEGVDRGTYDGLLAADSPGRYVNSVLKGAYNSRRA